MPGTSLRVVYRKPHWGSQLVARLDYFQDQQKGPITRAEFLARALKAANDKARLDRVRCHVERDCCFPPNRVTLIPPESVQKRPAAEPDRR